MGVSRIKKWHWYGYLSLIVFGIGIIQAIPKVNHIQNNQDLVRIGIIQRLGESEDEQVTLTGMENDQLKLEFMGDNGQNQVINTNKVDVKIDSIPIDSLTEEKLVVGDYRSFEMAENTARNLESKGVEAEIAHPKRWQVWAKRSVYTSPSDRQQLLEKLKNSGYPNAYLDQVTRTSENVLTWTVNGQKYQGKDLIITTNKNLIKVKRSSDKQWLNYQGILKFQPNAYGTFTLVNNVPVETYLRGVVPHELNAGAPYEANAAQAIIARTYLLRNRHRFKVDNYELCADAQCQVYKGLTGTNPNADRAIADTKGQVLTYNNELIDALYSSTTGGVTASFTDVWNGSDRPYLKPIIDGVDHPWNLAEKDLSKEDNLIEFLESTEGFNENKWNTFRWSYDSKFEDITRFLNLFIERTKNPFGKIDYVGGLRVVERSVSGRVLVLSVLTNKGEFRLYKDDIRSAFEAPRSTLFYLKPLFNRRNNQLIGYTFIGGGLGHGVGLSQTGTYNLAKNGWNREKILRFYYPNTTMKTWKME